MCYSQTMSLGLALMGVGAYLLTKNKHPHEAMVIAFYTSMEILQTIQYNYIDQCSTFENKFLTIVAHILVSVQPSLWNLYRFKTNKKNKEIFAAFFWLGVIFGIFYSVRLLFGMFDPKAIFPTDEMNVSPILCTKQCLSHLCWMLPYVSFRGLEPNYFMYLAIWFFPTFYEDSNRILKFIFWIAQVLIIYHSTAAKDEVNSIWCLLSIPLFIGFFFTKKLKNKY